MTDKDSKIKWFYLIGFFLILALPLLNIPPWFSPPDWGKTIMFRIIFSVMLFVFACNTLSGGAKLRKPAELSSPVKKSLSFWLLISLLGIFFLATVFSLDSHFSLWGYPYRGGGFVNFAFYIFFAILAFIILQKKDWQKIWDFTFLIGILVSLIAISQKLGFFSDILISSSWRPCSTTGAPSFLAIYLLLLFFLALTFGIQKTSKKSLFYFFCSGLFLFVIFLTATRAAFLGLFIGFLFFIFFYPRKKTAKLKILLGIILISGILGAYWLNSQPQTIQSLKENKIFGPGFERAWSAIQPLLDIQDISFSKIVGQSRFSGWKVAWQAVKQRPILGYGPENFSIGFDKYYNPAIPGITESIGYAGGWWDRAHNFVFEIGVCAGIPALIIYLLLFAVLFWQLQKLKLKNPSESVVYHGIQATFLAYLTANFFSFDSYSSYIISFLLIAYSLHLIIKKAPSNAENIHVNSRRYSRYFASILFIGLIWFIYVYNIKPLHINKEIKLALWELRAKNCAQSLAVMDNILPQHSIIDSYVRLEYIEIINQCIKKEQNKNKQLEMIQKATQALKENIEIQPNYTRSWWFLGVYTNYLIDIADKKELKQEANYYFEKANSLSPKRQEILRDWAKTHILTEEYEKTKQKSQECIEIKSDFRECWWLKALSQIYLGEIKQGKESLKIAQDQGYALESYESLSQLLSAYIKIESYPDLIEIYPKIIKFEPENFQYWASLAVCYKAVGDYENARKAAQKVIELSPESKSNVEAFLKSLP
ncbi:hypothetical protein AMJ49_04320 [Parcubacteria bacterium DG_74_2]|nr:MAG: hypothetical protein AMJ49_04320 [Parcubacteria bacterium DG_74_2]